MAYFRLNKNEGFNPDPKSEKKPPKIKEKKINPASKERAKENAEYIKEARKFIKGKICPVFGTPAMEVHHMKGRIGKLLLDKKYWLAVSPEGHKKIELNPEWAKEKGYSLNRL